MECGWVEDQPQQVRRAAAGAAAHSRAPGIPNSDTTK